MKLKEVDLFQPVKNLLMDFMGCSAVYGEVGSCDVLGLHGSSNVAVELKLSLTFHLLDQAVERLALAQYVYIAIPKRKRPLPRSARQFLKENKIGVIEVSLDDFSGELVAVVAVPARYNRLATDRYKKGFNKIRERIESFHGDQKGGVPSGEGVTHYSVTMDRIKSFLGSNRNRGKWFTVDEILLGCETHYANPKPSVMSTLQKSWNREWCENDVINGKRVFRYREKC